jgi:hypothetical protein
MMLAGSWWLRVACRLCTYMYLFHVLLFADMERRKEKKRKGKADSSPCVKELRADNTSAWAVQAEESPGNSLTISFCRPASCCSGRCTAASGKRVRFG